MENNIKQDKSDKDIRELQKALIPIVNELEKDGRIIFISTESEGSVDGNYWEPVREIKGNYLFEEIDSDSEKVVELSKKISDDYQIVVKKYLDKNKQGSDILKEGERWLFGKLFSWSGFIIGEGLLNWREIEDIVQLFEDKIKEKEEDFFGYTHGNVIGDHIFLGEDEKIYLFGMRVVPRPGKGYYDFLRSLDWMILKSDNKEIDFDKIVNWMKKYLSQYDWEEIKLVFSLRCIGILGWDMLHRGDFGKGDLEKKKEILLKFIKMEY